MSKKEIAIYFLIAIIFTATLSALRFAVSKNYYFAPININSGLFNKVQESPRVENDKNNKATVSVGTTNPKDKTKPTADESAALKTLSSEIDSLKSGVEIIKNNLFSANKPSIRGDDLYNKAVSGALINILCEDPKAGNYISGSGAVVSNAGYILTNGHLGVYFGNTGVTCELRRGSPARPFAKARLVFLPDQAKKIEGTSVPASDIAILKIERMLLGGASSSWPYFELDPNYSAKVNESFYSLGYPTEFLGAQTALVETDILLSVGVIREFVSVDGDFKKAEGAYLDGQVSAQHGSSGGIFLETGSGKIAGLFVGLTEGKTTSDRKQFIFLSSYIDSMVRAEKGLGFNEFIQTNP